MHTWEWDCNDIPALTHFTQLFSPPSLWGLPFIAAGYWGCHTGNRGVGKKSWVCVYVCVSVRVRGRGKLCEFLREKVSCKCVRMGKIVCVCCHSPAAFPLGALSLTLQSIKAGVGRDWTCVLGCACVRGGYETMPWPSFLLNSLASNIWNTKQKKKYSACERGCYLYAGEVAVFSTSSVKGKPMNIVRDEWQQIKPVFTGGKRIATYARVTDKQQMLAAEKSGVSESLGRP